MAELPWLYAAMTAYGLATVMAFYDVMPVRSGRVARHEYHERLVLGLLATAVMLMLVTLSERWLRLGHGPFVNLFELLMSQLFSLGVIYTLVYWRVPVMRRSALVALPMLWILGLWVLVIEPLDSVLPPTYHNDWLWAHVGFGKIFLSFCLLGSSLAGVLLLRRWALFQGWFRIMPADKIVDALAWRFMLIAFAFHTLMLIAGAVWAQDAWGRYWAWDALETSSFLNWLLLGAALHARVTYKVPMRVGAVLIIVVFVFAFFTYFGAPFYSEAAHKGVI
jgi:ABC-type transport system involved in cytochrome c biogenesis permease subunit